MAASDLYGWFPRQSQVYQTLPADVMSQGPVGAYGRQAQGLLGSAMRTRPPGDSGTGGFGMPPIASGGSTAGSGGNLMGPNGVLGGSSADNQRFSSFGSGALAGSKFGPWGALIGGLVGYGAAGGVKDANPIDASGFSGTTMDQAWENQNIARLASNPAAAVASKLGVSSNSVLGKVLDPAGIFGGGGKSKKRNWSAFNEAFPGTTVDKDGNYVLPQQFGGATVNQKQLDELAGTWYGATYAPDGDQSGWQDKYNNVLSGLLSQPMYNDFGG